MGERERLLSRRVVGTIGCRHKGLFYSCSVDATKDMPHEIVELVTRL